jgi:ABC-type sugar transport system ATPase subunit
MARIQLQNVTRSYANARAVDGLDLDIANGELLVLLGPSGCGKTTTLDMIAGLQAPSSGSIFFDGKDVTAQPPHRRNIAMVFQSSLLYPHVTARRNIALSLKRSGLAAPEIAARIDETAAILGIARLLDKLPSELSGGERQRVATAKAIVRHPAAFLLDEPLAALDAALRLTLRSELVNLQKRLRTTMVFVTHDQVEAMTMGDRIGVMAHGRLDQIGTPTDIYNRPETLFVAGFVGSPPMNFFDGELIETNARLHVRLGPVVVPVPSGHANPARALRNGKVTLAVRPQHVQVLAAAAVATLPATVFALEHLGKESIVIFETAQVSKVRAIVAPDFQTQVGDILHVRFDPERALLFDRDTGRAIQVAAPPTARTH